MSWWFLIEFIFETWQHDLVEISSNYTVQVPGTLLCCRKLVLIVLGYEVSKCEITLILNSETSKTETTLFKLANSGRTIDSTIVNTGFLKTLCCFLESVVLKTIVQIWHSTKHPYVFRVDQKVVSKHEQLRAYTALICPRTNLLCIWFKAKTVSSESATRFHLASFKLRLQKRSSLNIRITHFVSVSLRPMRVSEKRWSK